MNHKENIRSQAQKIKEQNLVKELKKSHQNRRVQISSFRNRLAAASIINYRGPVRMSTTILDNLSEFDHSNNLENYFDNIQSNIVGSIINEYENYNI